MLLHPTNIKYVVNSVTAAFGKKQLTVHQQIRKYVVYFSSYISFDAFHMGKGRRGNRSTTARLEYDISVNQIKPSILQLLFTYAAYVPVFSIVAAIWPRIGLLIRSTLDRIHLFWTPKTEKKEIVKFIYNPVINARFFTTNKRHIQQVDKRKNCRNPPQLKPAWRRAGVSLALDYLP